MASILLYMFNAFLKCSYSWYLPISCSNRTTLIYLTPITIHGFLLCVIRMVLILCGRVLEKPPSHHQIKQAAKFQLLITVTRHSSTSCFNVLRLKPLCSKSEVILGPFCKSSSLYGGMVHHKVSTNTARWDIHWCYGWPSNPWLQFFNG